MSDLAQQIVEQATELATAEPAEQTFASFEDALGASMSAEEVAQTEQLLAGTGAGATESPAVAQPSSAAPPAPVPTIAPAAPALSPEFAAFMQQQAYIAQQQAAALQAQQAQHQALMAELQAARQPPPPPDNTPPEVKAFKEQLRQEFAQSELAPLKQQMEALVAEQRRRDADAERAQRTNYYVNEATQVADQAVLGDLDPSVRAQIAPAARDLVLAVAAAAGKAPKDVAPIVQQLISQAADAKIKTLQMQAKARVQANVAAPPQPQLRAVAAGDSFDPTKLSNEELRKMGARDPFDAIVMARKAGRL